MLGVNIYILGNYDGYSTAKSNLSSDLDEFSKVL